MAVDLGETLGFLLAGAVWWLVKFYYGSYVNVSSYMLYRRADLATSFFNRKADLATLCYIGDPSFFYRKAEKHLSEV